VNFEGIHGPSGPYILADFHNRDVADKCIVMSDRIIGGYSKSNLDWRPFEDPFEATFANDKTASKPASAMPEGWRVGAHVRFHGTISTELPRERRDIQRSGFAAFRTGNPQRSIFGRQIWDIDPWAYMGLRIKSDGRSYFVNIQTESVEPTDIHQHRLFAQRPGEWETVLIPWNEFVRTNHGHMVEPQSEILRQKVKTIGIGLTDRVAGPFELLVERIWATNGKDEVENAVLGGAKYLKGRIDANTKATGADQKEVD
jgi:NADH dehydrogenase [ubiquinone] 1 alpha subcomplex assembly factor 1